MHRGKNLGIKKTKFMIVATFGEKVRRWDEGRAHRELNAYLMMIAITKNSPLLLRP